MAILGWPDHSATARHQALTMAGCDISMLRPCQWPGAKLFFVLNYKIVFTSLQFEKPGVVAGGGGWWECGDNEGWV